MRSEAAMYGGEPYGGSHTTPHGGGAGAGSDAAGREFVFRMLIPEASAGAVIGKHGTIIRSLCETSRATIRLSPPERPAPGLASGERIVAISGTRASVVAAAVAVFLTLVGDPRK